ncbi:MAG: dephospho-CoA kinase [Alphaproteobacteria bacterium]|nr:dephospho-CoA kinase [Alphaproteobacteria bacterium]
MVIGLTGSMGAGKSTTSQMLTQLGFFVFDADDVCHKLMENPIIIQKYKEKVPQCVIDGVIDRNILSKMVVDNKVTIEELEDLIIPSLNVRVNEFIYAHLDDIVVLDVPLLFEKKWDKYCEKIIYVTASLGNLKSRVMKRPGMSEEKYKALMSNFLPEKDKKAKSDYIIETDYGLDYVRNKLNIIKEELLEIKSKQKPKIEQILN